MVRTRDGGKTWESIPPPPAHVDSIEGCRTKQRTLSPCVDQIRFATPEVGYAYGPDLFVTRDGGATWRRQSTDTFALEPSGDTVVRYTARSGTAVVQSQPVDGTSGWRDLPAHMDGVFVGALLHRGRQIFVIPNVALNQAIYRSRDSGAIWDRLPSPCEAPSAIRDASSPAPDSLIVLCVAYQAAAFVRVSSDGGNTFGPARTVAVPEKGFDPQHVAAATPDVLLTSDDADNVEFSSDGGQNWQVVLTRPDRDVIQRDLGLAYQDVETAHVIEPPNVVATTTDRGRHWTSVPVR